MMEKLRKSCWCKFYQTQFDQHSINCFQRSVAIALRKAPHSQWGFLSICLVQCFRRLRTIEVGIGGYNFKINIVPKVLNDRKHWLNGLRQDNRAKTSQ